MEELKGELSQTKLELETTLKTQHKHLKELDTLRLDVKHKCMNLTDQRGVLRGKLNKNGQCLC